MDQTTSSPPTGASDPPASDPPASVQPVGRVLPADASVPPAAPFAYPPGPRGTDADELHGVTVPDPYRALEDPSSDVTVAWSTAQADLLEQHRATWTSRPAFAERLRELLRTGAIGTPVWRGDRAFQTRRLPDQEHAVLLTFDPGPDDDPYADDTERVLVDPMAIDPSGTTTLDTWQPSKEGTRLAYQVSEGGSEESVLRVLDVATGDVIDGPIDRARYSPVAWLPGGDAFYYVRRLPADQVPADERQLHRRVYLHRLGTDPSADVLVFGDGLDKTNYYGVSVSLDGRWLIVSAAAGTAPRNDVWIADLRASSLEEPAFTEVVNGLDAQVSAHVGRDGRLYVGTDLDAPRGRLAVADPTTPTSEHWTDLIPEDPDAVLGGHGILDGTELAEPLILVSKVRHAISELTVHRLSDGTPLHRVELPGLGSIGGLSTLPEGGHEAWFAYTDHTTPTRILYYEATSLEVDVWAEPPGQANLPDVHTEQVTYRSADGTEVRMVIVAPAPAPAPAPTAALAPVATAAPTAAAAPAAAPGPAGDAAPAVPRPAVLYGYGGFGVMLTPSYSATTLAWVEAGGVWAVAGLRGGAEEGELWHRDGMREHKQNVFDDFHAAADHLVAQGWTTPDRLGIFGGSNGGLLVGAALTQRPEAYRAVICSAPLLDMVRYERFGLGVTWNDEYGTADDPEELAWLLGYSPYHHVVPDVGYPAVLFTAFDGDTRVDPLHARKMAAALQEATSGDPRTRPVLIRAERDVGHGGRAVSRTVDLAADQLGFLRSQLTGGDDDGTR